jgi:hypothetical protein
MVKSNISKSKRWWHYLFNIDVIFVIVIFIVAVYLFFTNKRSTLTPQGVRPADLLNVRHEKKFNVHEEACRKIFERLFNKRFQSIRPDWLKNPHTGRNLELDGYCSEIYTPLGKGLAFEYDGQQHAEYNKHFHKSPQDFVKQVKRDFWKDKVCKQHGILLIRIPHYIPYDDLEKYIKLKLSRYRLLPDERGSLEKMY